nr:MAG TPA: hypothetical protein [Caudoviricetes sp.]
MIKGKVTWFWDSLMNQDHLTVRIAKHQDVMGNKPNPLLTHTGAGSNGIELLRGFLTRDITFSATNEWGEAKDSIKDTVASQTGIDTGALGNDNGWVESAVRGLGGMAKSFFEMVGMDKTAENIDNAMREELKALSYKLVNYAEAAKTYQGTAVNFPNTLSVLIIADKYGKDPRSAIHNVLGDFLGIPVASLTKEIENTAVKKLEADGALKADASWPSGAQEYWNLKMEERQLRASLEQAKNNLKYLEDPTNIQLQRTQAVQGGDPDQDNTQAIANAKRSIEDYTKKLNENLKKQKDSKVSAGDLKLVEAKLSVKVKGENTGDNVTTDGVANSIAGKVLDLIGTTKNLLTQGNWEFMGPPGGYLYDPEATRNNKSHPGTITLFISNHMVVHNLLVSNVDIDISQFVTVEGYPLWVRADISFVPASLFTSRDIARSLGGSGRIYGLWDESLANADASNKGGTKQYMSTFKAVRLWEAEPKIRRDGHNEKDENQRFANLGFDPNGKEKGVFSDWSTKKNPDNQNYRVVIVNEEKERVNKEISKAETTLKNDSKGYNIDSSQNSATFRAALDRSSDVAKNAMEAINSAQRSNPGFKSLNGQQMKGFMDKFELKRTALEAPLYNFLGQKQN